MGMSVGGGQGGPVSEPNIVPLIDVLLVLIIIFMVITPKTPTGLDALVPQPPPPNQKQQPDDNKTIVVQVAPNGKLKINQDDTTWEQLGPKLTDIFKQRADKVAFVKGDPDLEFQVIAKAIDIAHSAGIDKVGLMTPKVEAGQ